MPRAVKSNSNYRTQSNLRLSKIRDTAKTTINESYFEKYDPPAAKENSEVEDD